MTDKKVKLLTARLTAGGEHEGSEAAEALEYKRCINAVDELGRIGHSQAVPVLVQAGKNKKMRFVARSHASSTLGDIRDPQAILALIKALDDKAHSSSVQEDIIIMLTAIKDPQAVPALVRALGDKSTLVRIKAAEALGAWESREAVPALIAALKDQNSAVTKDVGEEHGERAPLLTQWVCNEAAIALGKIGDARAVPALDKAWRDETYYSGTQSLAIEALGAIGGPLAVHSLVEALDNAEYGQEAVKALAMIGAAAFPALTEALSREKKRPLIIPALIEIVQADEYLLPRCRAAEALKAIAAHQPDPALRAALPALRWNHRRNNRRHQNPVFQEALEQIEAVTATSRSLPLPAAAPPPDTRTLPRPATAADVPAGTSAVPVCGFWRRLRRRLTGSKSAARRGSGKEPQMNDKQRNDEAVGKLIAELQSLCTFPSEPDYPDWGKCAVEALVKIGPPAVPALIQGLKYTDHGLNYGRAWAAKALGEIKDPRAVPALIKAIKDLSEEVGAEAVWALGRLEDPRVVPALIPALTRVAGLRWLLGKEALTYFQVNEAAAIVLGRLRDPQAVPALIQVLQNKNSHWRVRQKAVDALRAIGDLRAVPALTEVLQDKNLYFLLRHNAAEALESLGERQAVPTLIKSLQGEGVVHEGIVPHAAGGRVRDPQVVPPMLQVLWDKTVTDSEHRRAIKAIGATKHPQAVAALAEFLKDCDDWVCGDAVTALQAIGTPQAVLALVEALHSEQIVINLQAAEALKAIGTLAVPTLIEAFNHPSREVRYRVVEVLGVIKDPQSVPALIGALTDKDRDWLVRSNAAEALGLIGTPQAVPALIKVLQDVPLLAASLQNASLLAESLNVNDLYVCKSAAEGLQAIMQHYSDLDLRAALPALRRLRKGGSVFQQVSDQIESVTAASKSLPLPAAAPPLDVQTLPQPAAAEDVPLAAAVTPSQGWRVRLRRALRGF